MVSVVIPVYNCEQYLEACLRSLMSQSYRNIEMIVVNDGSTDKTVDICLCIAQEDNRIRVFHQDNRGVSAARNRGISVAKGKYIMFVDADDVVPSCGIEKLRKAADTGVDWVIGSYEEMRGKFTKPIFCRNRYYLAEEIQKNFSEFDKYISTPWAKLYKNQLIEDAHLAFDEDMHFGEDHVFNLFYSKAIKSVQVIDSIVYHYRLGGYASSVQYHTDHHKNHLALLRAYIAFWGDIKKVPKNLLDEKMYQQIKSCMLHYMVHCSKREALNKLAETSVLFLKFAEAERILEYINKEINDLLTKDAEYTYGIFFKKYRIAILAKRLKIKAIDFFKKKTGIIYTIGLVTIFDNNNYGNRLQNYALRNILEKYTTSVITIKNKPFYSKKSRMARMLPFAESELLNRVLGMHRRADMVGFTCRYIPFSKKNYWYDRDIQELNKRDCCTLYCAGSDQLWNPVVGRTGMFNYLGFTNSDRTFSYAASFGVDNIPEAHQESVCKGLQHIKFLSIREDAGKRIVEELTGRTDVQVHVDPTLLLTPEEWNAVAKKPRQVLPEKYMLTYFLGTVSPERRAALEEKARELGCGIVALMDRNGPYYNNGPSEFLWLMKHAQLVCTDSFHGSVFAFLYGKPLTIFDRQGSGEDMSSRLKTLADRFDLHNCMASGDALPEIDLNPDYSKGYIVLEKERERSKAYFDMVFQEAERLGLCD